jgi:hypothetical protein
MPFKFNPITGSLDSVQDVSNLTTGPASTSDNTVPRFDGTTGKLLQSSSVTIDDTGKLTLGADGTASLDAVTKQQLDAAIGGVDVKEGVKAASTANLTLSGEQTVDGIALVTGDRILVKDQSTATENGIYVIDSGAWARATDSDSANELNGALVTVKEGTANENTGWYQNNEITTVGSDNVVFEQFFGAGTYTADGQGIELSGSTFSLELDGSTLQKSASGLKVADLGIDSAQIAGGAITSTKIANNAVTTNTINANAVTDAKISTGVDAAKLADGSVSNTEFQYINTLTSNAQTQLDAKLDDSQLDTNKALDGDAASDTQIPSQKAVQDFVNSRIREYIADPGLETGVGDWSTFDDASAYVDGTGGTASNLTLSSTTTASEVLAGTTSGSLAKAAADAQYEGMSVSTLTIAREDRGNALSGTITVDASDANYASGDLKLFAYDVTNSQILLVRSLFDENNEIPAGVNTLGFQVFTESTTAEVRISLMVNSTNASAWEVFFDSVTLGPQGFFPGESTLRQGGYKVVGTRNNGSYAADNLDGISFSGDNLLTTSGTDLEVLKDNTVVTVVYGGDTSVESAALKVQDDSSGSFSDAAGSVSGSTTALRTTVSYTRTLNAGDKIRVLSYQSFTNLTAIVTAEKSLSNLMSKTEAFFKTTKARVSRNTTQSIPSGTITTIQFGTPSSNDYNDFNAFNTSTYKFVAPTRGTVDVKAFVDIQANATGTRILYLRKTTSAGTSDIGLDFENSPSSASVTQLDGSSSERVEAGDTIEIAVLQNSGSSLTVANSGSPFCRASFTFEPDITTYGAYAVEESASSSAAKVAAVDTNWGDFDSFTVGPGTYDFFMTCSTSSVSTASSVYCGFSTTSGNVSPGTEGIDYTGALVDASAVGSFSWTWENQTFTEETTVYIKRQADTTNASYGYKAWYRRVN